MAAGDPGVLKRNFSATAIQTSLVNSITSAATGDTTTSVAVVSVSGFPSTVPYTLILDPDGSKEEVVTVTAATSTTLTITRGQDNTQAVSHAAGTSVRHGVSGRDFKEEQTHQAARGYDNDTAILASAGLTHIHGLAANDGNVVGSLQAVTLTRKTLTTPTINGATLTGTVSSTASIVVSGAGTITGLSSAGMVSSSAAPKDYVDSILGSATAASTSATSAATSATSAATSATSAATSATSAATSASSALTSATSATTSASSASTSAASALTSQTAAATSATSAATSATSAATSASSALTSQTAAATSATSASTSATSAAASATAAGTSATSAAASATAAATSATSAAASATAASTSQTAAATSASSALTSASSAATSASSAATSATSSAASTSAAATSAASAATSATSAASSATSAASSFLSFDVEYLGSKASAPTLNNQGGALITGALYWNSVSATMFSWTGSAWGSISSTAAIFRYKFIATGGETSVSGADANGLTLSYLTGKEQVYLNGVLLVRTTDYAATTGTSITGLAALVASDVLEIITFTAFDVATSIANSLFTAKGDILVATAASTPGKLALGTNGYYLKADSTQATGLAWAAVDLSTYAPLASPTFTGTVTIPAGVVGTAANAGYMGIPKNSATTGSYSVVAADNGTFLHTTTTRTITLPANGTLALPIGFTISFTAATGATVTIAITTDTMYLAGTGTTGSRTLAPFGMATAVKTAATEWMISGNGLT